MHYDSLFIERNVLLLKNSFLNIKLLLFKEDNILNKIVELLPTK